MKHINFFSISLLTLTFTTLNWAQAFELADLKKLDQQILPSCKMISPLYGYSALKSGILQSLRISSAFGVENKQFPCNKQIGNIEGIVNEEEKNLRRMQRQKFCPQDFTSTLLQMFFPSPTGVLRVNTGSLTDKLLRLSPEIIGRLLEKIHLTHYNPDEFDLYDSILGPVSANIDPNEKIANSHDKCPNEKRERKLPNKQIRKKYDQFVKTLIGALKETQSVDSPYPANLVPEILTAYSLSKYPSINDLTQLIDNMGVCKNPKAPLITDQKYHKLEYFEFTNSFEGLNKEEIKDTIRSKLNDFRHHPEKAIFLLEGKTKYEKNRPDPVGTGQVTHSSLPGNLTYPDCAEASLRSFFNNILFNKVTGLFDTSILEKIIKENGTFDLQSVIAFYQKHSDPAECLSIDARQEWSNLIANLKGPSLLGHCNHGVGKCHLDAGNINTLKVFHALFEKDPNWEVLETVVEKWDYICRIFSDKEKKLDWVIVRGGKNKIIDKDENNIAIDFTLKGHIENVNFNWNFTSGHNELTNAKNQSYTLSWDSILFELLMEDFEKDDPLTLLVLPWLMTTPDSIMNLAQLKQMKFLWSFDLMNIYHRAQTLEYLTNQEDSNPPLTKEILVNWIKTIPLDHFYIASRVKKYLKKYHINDHDFKDIYQRAKTTVLNENLPIWVKNNNIEKITKYINRGHKLEIIEDINHKNLLQLAIHHNYTDLAKLIFDANPSLAVVFSDSEESAILKAARKDNKDLLFYFCNSNHILDSSKHDDFNRNILHEIFQRTYVLLQEDIILITKKFPKLLLEKDKYNKYPFSTLFGNPDLYDLLNKIIIIFPEILNLDLEIELSLLLFNIGKTDTVEKNNLLFFIAEKNHRPLMNLLEFIVCTDKASIIEYLYSKEKYFFTNGYKELAFKAAKFKSEDTLNFLLKLYPELYETKNEQGKTPVQVLEYNKAQPDDIYFAW